MTGRAYSAEACAKVLAAPKPNPALDPGRCACHGVVLGCPSCCAGGGAEIARMVTWPWLT